MLEVRAISLCLPGVKHADDAITAALDEVAHTEGFLMCPEGAATYAALKQALADGRIRRDEQAVLFNCATGPKSPLPHHQTPGWRSQRYS